MNDLFGFVIQQWMMFGDVVALIGLARALEKLNWYWDARHNIHQSRIFMELICIWTMVLLVTPTVVDLSVCMVV